MLRTGNPFHVVRTTVTIGAGAALLSLTPPSPTFEPLQPELFGAGGAFTNAFADYDGDGDADLFVGFNGAPNRLYGNDGGRFTDVAAEVGLAHARATRAVAWGDFDGDGDPDIAIGFAPGVEPVLQVFRNERGRFVPVSREIGVVRDSGAVRQLVWVDYDGDGDLDLFVAFRDRANVLLRNDGGRFEDVAAALGLADTRRTVGAVWFDYDEDGDLDLYVANMDGDANGLYRQTNGSFRDVAAEAGVQWGGRTPADAANGTVRPCVADVNNDGRLDLFTANYGKNGLFLNRGGRFEDVSEAWGVAVDSRYDACAFADFDNDGRVDLYVNGTVTGGVAYRDHLFRNEGNRFVDVTPGNILALDADHGVQWEDVDGDGAVDLALTGSRSTAMHLVLRNILPAADARRSLRVAVKDERGRAVLAGAEIRLYAAGTRERLGTRWVDAGSGYDSQNSTWVHFGLPRAGLVDVEVIVPARGVRRAVVLPRVDPGDWARCPLTIAVGAGATGRAAGGRGGMC